MDGDIIDAIHDGDLHTVKRLINGINKRDEDYGYTALMWASVKGRPKIVKYLISKGAHINAKDKYGRTALILIGGLNVSKRMEIAKLLVSSGADLNIRDKNGETALIIAAVFDDLNTVKLLVSNGADLNIRTNKGKTALMYAVEGGAKRVIKFLISKGANMDYKNKESATALMMAAEGGQTEVVKLLLGAGANVNIKNKRGLNAAGNAKNKEIKILLKHPRSLDLSNLRKQAKFFKIKDVNKKSKEELRVELLKKRGQKK